MDFNEAMGEAERETLIDEWTAGAQFLVMGAVNYVNAKTTKNFQTLTDIVRAFGEVDREILAAGIEPPLDAVTPRTKALIQIVRDIYNADEGADVGRLLDQFDRAVHQFTAKAG